MGRSVQGYSCPCGYLGTSSEFVKHKKHCQIYKSAITNDAIFKLMGYKNIKRR